MEKKISVLVVEDEPDINELIRYNLEQEGYNAHGEFNGTDAVELIKKEAFDLIILDLMLPGMNGLDICKYLKGNSTFSDIPVIMVTAKEEEIDRVLGLELGADDYLTKPFSPRELLARIKAVLRRTYGNKKEEKNDGEVLVAGKLEIDIDRVMVKKEGVDLNLSSREYNLLLYLVQNKGKVYKRDLLLDRVWGDTVFVEPRTVDVHIRRLREKVEDTPANPQYILTKRGAGYYFSEENSE
ncbi:MAG: response regulator transcription factor [Nitrospinae bacterium]|nr:response regulator transcription factor [Nitrospinota bacterium]